MSGIPAMDCITERIWIGNHLDAQDREALAAAGIRSVLCLDGCLAGANAAEMGLDHIEVVELIDGAGNPPARFLRAVRWVRELAERHGPVLVHCHAGRSRSAAVVCRHFMIHHGESLGTAMGRITRKRRVVITPGLQEVLDFK